MYSFRHISSNPLFFNAKYPSLEAKLFVLEDDNTEKCISKPWRPVTFRRPFLIAMILLTGILITAVAVLLRISLRNQGIIFATEINNLPLRQSFGYLYLPTIISVLYSFGWSWIDLDIKRLEPFFQLSKARGATGDQSVLLSYPLEFLITVPFSALKRKHWTVLSGSVIIMLVFWGLTPTQSGIFAVRTITIHDKLSSDRSSSYKTIEQQGNLSSDYAQSVYNIAWLNETLPPFMTKDFMLNPFALDEEEPVLAKNSTLAMETTLYSVDVDCTPTSLTNNSGVLTYNSGSGCNFSAPAFRPMGGGDLTKPFDTLYAGYQNKDGFADYYLSADCKDSKFSHLFFVRWSKMTPEGIRAANGSGNVDARLVAHDTSLFCQASYYQQQVNATVRLPKNEVLHVEPVKDSRKSPLPNDMFNISSFEWAMASGQEQVPLRGLYPVTTFPSQKSQLLDMPLNLAYIPKMAPFAIATHKMSAEDYLDPETLRSSYESAYRLLFARQLSDILSPKIKHHSRQDIADGHLTYTTQAVVVVPGFAYAAIAMLSIVFLLACGLLATIPSRPNKLQYDPATLGSLMDLLSGDRSTPKVYGTYEDADTDSLLAGLRNAKFALQEIDHSGTVATRLRYTSSSDFYQHDIDEPPTSPLLDAPPIPPKQGIRPFEMKLIMGAVFLGLQVAAIITFTILFIQAKHSNGLELPSGSTFVRQLVENYIPIALATLIEPFWLVLNRLLGLLQPFEELRKGSVSASRSVDLDYSSLPPQLLMVRALKARHYVLMLVCFMVLLANVLAVALSGLMYEGTALISRHLPIKPIYELSLQTLNGTGLPFNGALEENFDGGTTVEAFYRKMSNLTADTPLPPWADDHLAYMPFDLTGLNSSSTAQMDTTAIGANLDCREIPLTGEIRYDLAFEDNGGSMNITITLPTEDGRSVQCTNLQSWISAYGDSAINSLNGNPSPGHQALELNAVLASPNASVEDDLFCRQHILAGWVRAEWQATRGKTIYGVEKVKLASKNETMILCRPEIFSGAANILVDRNGRVLENFGTNPWSAIPPGNSTAMNFIAQINQFLITSEATWHNDSFPSDLTNYLIVASENITSPINPSKPAPSPQTAIRPYAAVYTKLFPILIATNFPSLFHETASSDTHVPPSTAKIRTPEIRILLSTPAFIITQTILILYVSTTVFFYARRPWRVLPRLPSSVASNLAFFASSRALKDLSALGVDLSGKSVRATWRWGYGGFVDGEGRRRVGVEREPFVRGLK